MRAQGAGAAIVIVVLSPFLLRRDEPSCPAEGLRSCSTLAFDGVNLNVHLIASAF